MGIARLSFVRKGSPYRSGRSPDWLKMKNPEGPAVKREAEEAWAKRNGDDRQDGCGDIELSRVGRVCWARCNYTLGSGPVECRNYRNHSCSISMLFTRLPSLRLPISSDVKNKQMELRRHLLGFFKATMDVGDAAWA
jgi:hypothetical protein